MVRVSDVRATRTASATLERITHSLCTSSLRAHRPLYDWVLERLVDPANWLAPDPQRIEFARVNLSYTVMSKRKLLELVEGGVCRQLG